MNIRQPGRIETDDGEQHIQPRAVTAEGDLPYSARINWKGVVWKIHGEGSLLTSGDNYVAKISIPPIPALAEAPGFLAARDTLLKHVTIVKVIQDDLGDAYKAAEHGMRRAVEDLCAGTFVHVRNAEDLLQLAVMERRRQIFDEKSHKKFYERFLDGVTDNECISEQLKSSLEQYIGRALEVLKRNRMMQFISIDPDEVKTYFKRSIHRGFVSHRQQLLKNCPSGMRDAIEELYDNHLLFITADDLKLFVDLVGIQDAMTLDPVLPVITSKFLNRIRQIQDEHLRNWIPLSNPVYYFLCKNLVESTAEILAVCNEAEVVFHGETEWKMRRLSRGDRSPKRMCLERQLEILVHMVNHFEPGKHTANQPFPYEFDRLSLEHEVPMNVRCWFSFLDHVVQPLLPPEVDMRQFHKLLDTYVRFISNIDIGNEHLESLRVLTNNLVRLIGQVGPSLCDRSELENTIFNGQRRFIHLAELNGRLTLKAYRDVVGVFGQFWDHSDRFVAKLPSYAKQLHTTVLNIACMAVEKEVEVSDLVRFHKRLIGLVVDLGKLPFDWILRFADDKDIFLRKNIMDPVNNRWRNTEHECYRVLDYDCFVRLYQALQNGPDLPRKYFVETIQTLLDKLLLIDQIWNQAKPTIQLDAAVLLIDAIRNSLIFLEDYEDYTCFEQFYQDSVRPFDSVVNNCISCDDFRNRTVMLKEAFLHYLHRETIDLERGLMLFREYNTDNFNETELRHAWNSYNQEFGRFMFDYDGHQRYARKTAIREEVLLCCEQKRHVEWTPQYKQAILPKVLAGIAAVWSILESKDIELTNKYLEPNCIQILCIWRMLCVDKPKTGILNHMAQVLTSQGKSVILAFTASLFALFGHKVKIVCHSPYLAGRDARKFRNLFEWFAIDQDIVYGPLHDLAEIQTTNMRQKIYNYLQNNIGNRETNTTTSEQMDTNLTRTVLLIDDVDVFSSEQCYGNTRELLANPSIPGLGLIQERIWEWTVQGHSEDVLLNRIKEFIQDSKHLAMGDFRAFTKRYQSYTMFDDNPNSQIMVSTTTNMQLFNRHLPLMLSSARKVSRLSHEEMTSFKLDNNGCITKWDEICGYQGNNYQDYDNTFAYFKLKQTGFQEFVNGTKNYGYLLIHAGSLSYAKLLERYPLILGVTATEMNRYERQAVEQNYLIRAHSVMPSFYGDSKLQFSPHDNFRCASTEKVWLQEIFARIDEIHQKDRSVLVFFDTEREIRKFTREFAARLSRWHLLTVGTEERDREHYISEAGATRMVTLATRQMGRGLDYKTSAAVERNGGVHVIQSFFSLDVREETRIKGRTARKGWKGSYELIVCLDHVRALRLTDGSAMNATYDELDRVRLMLMDEVGVQLASKLRTANERHRMTMEFYGQV